MPNIGDPAPQFSSTDVINNQTYNLSDYAGQVVLLVFSGPSWCGPCQFEAPVLQDLWEDFECSLIPPKVQVLMVSCFANETPSEFKTAVENFGLTFPALLNPDQTISSLYGVTAVPTLFVIDTEQKICNIHVGASPPAGALYEEIYNMLIGCGAAQPKCIKFDTSKWAAVVYILFGGINDAPGFGFTPGGKPVPIDPWGPLFRLSAEKKDIILHLAISELAKGVRDFKTAREIETAALTAAEASMRKLVARNALQPKDLDTTFSNLPKE
jgi:peroxiredoxin